MLISSCSPARDIGQSAEHIERAIYVSGAIEVMGQTDTVTKGELVVLQPQAEVVVQAVVGARLILIGGEPFSERGHIFWNFVSWLKEQIEKAKRDWVKELLDPVPEESELMPLPEDPKPVYDP